jgi:ribonucleoside-diphosphate reductase alpha chain
MTRALLPNRRDADVLRFEHDGIAFTGTIGLYPNDTPGEVFLEGGKPGSATQALARDVAVIASLAMQHGCPIESLRHAVTRLDDGSAAGPMGRLLDLIAAQGSVASARPCEAG